MSIGLEELQRIPTSGARAVEPVHVGGLDLLAVPQLAVDVPDTPAGMNGGDSDTELLVFQRVDGRYEPWSMISAPGGEDAEFFCIGDRAFLAVASIRSGRGPYDYSTRSQILTWDGSAFVPFQEVPSFAAKQWRHWSIGQRHFLGLAQGVALPGTGSDNRPSVVFEWDGSRFAEFQQIPSRWAYNWHPFVLDGSTYVAHAEHLDASVLYRWDGRRLQAHQELAPSGGRSFATFQRDGESYLVVACLQGPSSVMRWDGERFLTIQVLEQPGARELAAFEHCGRLFVARINFVTGPREDPTTSLISQVYEWVPNALQVVAEFPTTGGTDVAVIRDGPDLQLVVSNSLSPDVRFAAETVVYRLAVEQAA